MMQHEPTCIPVSGKTTFPTRACRICAAHGERSESTYVRKFYLVPLHRGKYFTKYQTLKKYQELELFIAFVNRNVIIIEKTPKGHGVQLG